MEHQDWNSITFNTKNESEKINKSKEQSKEVSNKQFNPETTKLEAPPNLGQTISQARNSLGKTQKTLATELGIAPQILSQWENGKFMPPPNNLQIANMEKILKTRLPRLERLPITEE